MHEGRAAVGAEAGKAGLGHLTEETVHLGEREDLAGADGAVAGDGGGDGVLPVLGWRLIAGEAFEGF